MMGRLFPAPLLSLSLAAIWVLLNGFSLGHGLLALAVGWYMPWAFAALRPQRPRIRRPWTLIRLILVVGRDVVISTVDVGRGVLAMRRYPLRSGFVVIPLELRDPSALAALAVITTVVPGTVWCELARDSSAVMLHVWNVDDEAAFIDHYKRTYEAPLLEIFQ